MERPQHRRNERLSLLIDHLRAIAPDVVALQETTARHAARVADALGLTAYVHEFDRPDEQVNTTAVLAAEVSWHQQVMLSERPFARAATVVRLPQLDDATLVSAHLDATADAIFRALRPGVWSARFRDQQDETKSARLEQLRLLTNVIPTGRAILAGDLNFMPDSEEYQWCTSHNWRDTWRAAPRFQPATTISADNPFLRDSFARVDAVVRDGYPGAAPTGYTLDFQFVRGDIRPKEAWTVGAAGPRDSWVSDHLGLVVDY